jgi:hypothetical protein
MQLFQEPSFYMLLLVLAGLAGFIFIPYEVRLEEEDDSEA